MDAPDIRLARLLFEAKLLDASQVREVQKHVEAGGGRFHRIAVELGFATEAQVAGAIAASFQLSRVSLAQVPPDPVALAKLDAPFCEQHGMFPCALRDDGRTLWVAVSDPGTTASLDAAARRAKTAIRPVVAGHDEIQEAILRSYRGETHKPRTTPATATIDEAVARGIELDDRPPPPVAGGLAAAESALDDLLGMSSRGELTAEEQARLDLLVESQARSAKALRAVVELCLERGLFDLAEYRSRVR